MASIIILARTPISITAGVLPVLQVTNIEVKPQLYAVICHTTFYFGVFALS